MYEVIFAYNFEVYKGKPKRELEKLNGCKIKSYGVVKDSVTLFILCEDKNSLNLCQKIIKEKYNINPKKINKLSKW